MRRAVQLWVACLLATVTAAAGLVSEPAGAAVSATYVRTIGRPGHAGLYAWGMATATNGTILVGDYNNRRIKRYSTSGQLLQSFSCGGTGQGCTIQPYGIAVDPNDGSIYVFDVNPPREVEKFNAAGQYVKTIVDPTFKYTARGQVDSQSRLIVVDSHNISAQFPNRVKVLDKDGNFLFEFGQNGTAPNQLGVVRGIAIGPNDDIYLSDVGNRRFDVYDKNGQFLRNFGTAGAGPCLLGADVRGLAMDKADRLLYAVDATDSRVEVFDIDTGQCVRSFGGFGYDPGQIAGGREITIGPDGNLYVADYTATKVSVFTPTGQWVREIPNPPQPAPNGGFNQPEGVAVSQGNGNVYVTDTFNHRIQQFTSTGTFLRTWGFRGVNDPMAMDYPRGLSVDPSNGNIWMNNTRSGNIKQYSASGAFVSQFGKQGRTAPEDFYYARGIHAGTDGRLYIPDSGNLRFKAVSKTGAVAWTQPCGAAAGTDNFILMGCTTAAQDSAGNVYTAAPTENKVYKFDRNGTLIWKQGVQGTGPGQVNQPYGVAVRGNRLYVSNMASDRINVYDLNFVPQGNFGSLGSSHGQFRDPTALAFDAQGRLYVVDMFNERVEVFTVTS